MEIIGIQTDIAWEDRDTNYARVRELLSGARVEPGALLVLPELFAVGFTMDEMKAERRRETELFLRDLARQYSCYVVGGVARVDDTGSVGNDALVMNPLGEVLTVYRKMHPFSLAGETEHYAAGVEICVAECGDWKVAPTICYDLRFPELYRATVAAGAELIVVIANWPVARIDHWTTLLKARAIENQAYVIGVNRVGQDPSFAYCGKSLIVDPRGQVLAEAGSGVQLMRARADRQLLLDWRAAFPALQDRRDDWHSLGEQSEDSTIPPTTELESPLNFWGGRP
jgi:omega-amidase